MPEKKRTTLGWGVVNDTGAEIWDAEPVILGDHATWKDWLKLIFYPKKLLLYRHIKKNVRTYEHLTNIRTTNSYLDLIRNFVVRMFVPVRMFAHKVRILDVGCGTGAAVVELKKIFGAKAEVVGVDVVQLQIDIARERLRQYGVEASVRWYDGAHLPFPDGYFDAVHTSDVLGHVADVPSWLGELQRVTAPGGVLAMFSESKLGRHAYVRNYLLRRGLNVDPHAEFHISLYSKTELRDLLEASGFVIENMYSTVWAKFLVHPDELYPALQGSAAFPILKILNRWLYRLKKKTYPYSTALAELYSFVEMLVIGRWVEAQGYVVLARKEDKK